MFLIDDIVLAPMRGVFSLVKVIHDKVEEELYNPEKIQEDLMKLQLRFEMDEISEEKYDELEEELLGRLAESKKRAKMNAQQ
ncbi:MAG: gas vesicle protein GvpG [Bacteroidota bacterium]